MKTSICVLLLVISSIASYAQTSTLEAFESLQGWELNKSDGVEASLSLVDGVHGKGIRFDYDFTKGSGYAGMWKSIPVTYPENYRFQFQLKASSPANNFEFKIIDSSGDNVWWMNRRGFEFPTSWKSLSVRKRQVEFAWGPIQDKNLKESSRLEFTIASAVGGKGYFIIDDLTFEVLESSDLSQVRPFISLNGKDNSYGESTTFITEDDRTVLQLPSAGMHELLLDYKGIYETGGLYLSFPDNQAPSGVSLLASENGILWDTLSALSNLCNTEYAIRLVDYSLRYVKIFITQKESISSTPVSFRIFKPEETEKINNFFTFLAQHSRIGEYPRYFSGEKMYWTVLGMGEDEKEVLISEDGMIELEKGRFSIEPVIQTNNSVLTWADVKISQFLADSYLPLPEVVMSDDSISLHISPVITGEANVSSTLSIQYRLSNTSDESRKGTLHLLVRPFQVNPSYQFLNITGGTGRIDSIAISTQGVVIDGTREIYSYEPISAATALSFSDGSPVRMIKKGCLPSKSTVHDPARLASAILSYDYELQPEGEKTIVLEFPLHTKGMEKPLKQTGKELFSKRVSEAKEYWKKKTDQVQFTVPASFQKAMDVVKSNLAYILINRDFAGIQPGSRSYERSWIRDGALTSSALLKMGLVKEVYDYINWYAHYQYEDGKIPCVVDKRGPDPVAEHDSHGEFIFLIKQYFNFTKDTLLLRDLNHRIIRTVDYIQSQTKLRSTAAYMTGSDSVRAKYGMMPESISHEGYSEKPMHSYWDNFFTMRGLQDAADIQAILGNQQDYERIAAIRDTFRINLYNSLRLAILYKNIDYIPGCVELGDFDPTSTTIALYPCNQYPYLPQKELTNTFEKYWSFFAERKTTTREYTYTPYEVRTIGSMIFLDKPERAISIIDFFLQDLRPQGWNHWAEVVRKGYRTQGFIGDMPHTWVGSDFINAVRAMFVYENDYDTTLIVGAGFPAEWMQGSEPITVQNLPTYYGKLHFSYIPDGKTLKVEVDGTFDTMPHQIVLKHLGSVSKTGEAKINSIPVMLNGAADIIVKQLPVTIEVEVK